MPSSVSSQSMVVAVDPYPPCSIFLLAFLCFRGHTRKRTTPSSDSESKPPHRFSYSLLRQATSSFSALLGHGGFGPVFSGSLPTTRKPVAVKLMDSASLQGEREFHNELFFASRLRSQHVVVATGFSSDRNRRRFLLVYELMPNGNLQDALLRRKCPELMNWKKRFAVIVDIAKGIRYLHSCDPPVIHGDIKPSNILLDASFSAKIGDYGLARLKSESQYEVENEIFANGGVGIDDCGSVVEETESVNTGFEEQHVPISETSPETEASPSEANFEKAKKNGKCFKSKSVKDWWGKQDDETAMAGNKKKNSRKELEWWREEHCEKLAKKKKKNKKKGLKGEDEACYGERKNSRRRNSIDWWFDGLSRNSHDSLSEEIHNPKSNGISSTPSMRGTVCYVAPEYNYGGEITEKCDVYGFGVLLLVIVSGRRPLEVVSGSPLSELQRGNLLSWARHCARNGKLLELVDQSLTSMKSMEKEEALLCIKVALLCLQKSASRRPSMEEVVGMLCGEVEPPQLPVEYSSSPPSRFPFKFRKNTE